MATPIQPDACLKNFYLLISPFLHVHKLLSIYSTLGNDSPVVMRLDAGVYRVEIVALGCDPVYKDTLIFRSI